MGVMVLVMVRSGSCCLVSIGVWRGFLLYVRRSMFRLL